MGSEKNRTPKAIQSQLTIVQAKGPVYGIPRTRSQMNNFEVGGKTNRFATVSAVSNALTAT